MNKNYKYVMIVTSEDERYESGEKDLSWFGEHPWEGKLVEVVFGNSFDELIGDGHNEGLFQQTYEMKTGKRLSYGFLDDNTPREEIEEYYKNHKNDWQDTVIKIAEDLDWNVKFDDGWITFSKYSSAGQDFNVEIEANDFETLCKELEEYYDNFDVSEETYLWLDYSGHGKNGAPYDMLDVYKDMEECKEEVEKLKYKLEQSFSKYNKGE